MSSGVGIWCSEVVVHEALDRPPPLAAGQRITVTIADIAFGGEGVARVESFVVFVPLVLAGEEVEIGRAHV